MICILLNDLEPCLLDLLFYKYFYLTRDANNKYNREAMQPDTADTPNTADKNYIAFGKIAIKYKYSIHQ